MTKKLSSLLYIFCLCLLASSCVPYKSIVYFQEKEEQATEPSIKKEFIPLPEFEYKIQPTDIVHIDVVTLDMETVEVFGMRQQNNNQMFQQAGPNNPVFYLTGYVVDQTGKIKLPVIGNIELGGLSVKEGENLVQAEIDRYFKDATVTLKLVSYRVNVLGEVRAPGQKIFYNDRVTIFDVLGQANGVTEFADLSKVRIYRSKKEGHEVIYVDLTDKQLITTENFFLLPNDVVYVEPLKARSQRFNLAMVGVVSSIISTVALIINLGINLNR